MSKITTLEKAPENHLFWLDDDEPEAIPETRYLSYDLTYDDKGNVAPSVVLRGADGESIGGVQLSYGELMQFAEWCFSNAVMFCKIDDLGIEGMQGRAYAKGKMTAILDTILSVAPEIFEDVLDHEAVKLIESRAKVEATRKTRVEAEAEFRAMERRYSREILKLAGIAASDSDQREAQLSDPGIQNVIAKAIQLCADPERTP